MPHEAPLPDRIRAARKSKGWSQAELGRRIGKKRLIVNGWENGRHTPSPESAALLAKALGGQATDWTLPAAQTPAQVAAKVPQLLETVEELQAEVLEIRKLLQALGARLEARGGGSPADRAFSPPAEPEC